MAKKRNRHRDTPQITLLAWSRHPDGSWMVSDVADTSYRYASHIARKWYRDPDIHGITARRDDCMIVHPDEIRLFVR